MVKITGVVYAKCGFVSRLHEKQGTPHASSVSYTITRNNRRAGGTLKKGKIMKTARIGLALAFVAIVLLVAGIAPASAGEVTVYVTSQQFDAGRMYWRSDTGLIWVFVNSGTVYSYPASSYSGLPDNPYFNPPAGHIRPINGFGKIWGSSASVRNQLGWAITQELGFQARIVTQGGITYLTELDGRILQINGNGTWQVAASIPTPPPDAPRIVAISATPNPVSAGSTLTVSWQVAGVETVIIEFYSTAQPNIPFTLLQDLPLSGSAPVTVPATITGDVTITIWAANRWHYYSPTPLYQRIVSQTITVGVQHPAANTIYTQAAYQIYEHGFMIWRADTGAVLAFWGDQAGKVDFFTQDVYGVLPDNPITYVPTGRVRSINGFGKVWGNYSFVRNGLGYALGPEEAYTLTVQTSGWINLDAYRLPDGRWARITGYVSGIGLTWEIG
jgi:hypothetical protein